MSKKHYISSLKGFLIGATMIVPGISGGSMAMILGIYDRLILSVSSFRKAPKDNFLFLSLFTASAGMGMLLFSMPLSWLMEHYPTACRYFFLGAVFGGIPLIEKKSRIQKCSLDVLFYLLIGFFFVFVFSFIPKGVFSQFLGEKPSLWIFLPAIGIITATAFILPGISVSHFLLVLGLYDSLLDAIQSMNFAFLCPLGIGIMLGIILFSKLLDYLMRKHPKQTYLTILGFILGSAMEIFPGIVADWSLLAFLFLAAAGFVLVYCLSKKES